MSSILSLSLGFLLSVKTSGFIWIHSPLCSNLNIKEKKYLQPTYCKCFIIFHKNAWQNTAEYTNNCVIFTKFSLFKKKLTPICVENTWNDKLIYQLISRNFENTFPFQNVFGKCQKCTASRACVEWACFPCAWVGCLRVFQLPPTWKHSH